MSHNVKPTDSIIYTLNHSRMVLTRSDENRETKTIFINRDHLHNLSRLLFHLGQLPYFNLGPEALSPWVSGSPSLPEPV